MASNSGVATARMVREMTAVTLMSGLAAGVLGGGWVGAQTSRDRLITFDVGGMSADIGIIDRGQIVESDARSPSSAGFLGADAQARHPHHRHERRLHRPR